VTLVVPFPPPLYLPAGEGEKREEGDEVPYGYLSIYTDIWR
jgi:hypothetical protein